MRKRAQWRAANARYRAAHPERVNNDKKREYDRKWRLKNPEKQKANRIRWNMKNPEKLKAINKSAQAKWRAKPENIIKSSEQHRLWVENNREHLNAKERERWTKNPAFRLGKCLRARLRNVIKNHFGRKSADTISLTGCSIEFLMGHLEASFKVGMKWSNYGSVWEIDHRIPCASYDLTDPSHQRSCFHYSNLQPLFRTENRRKHAKMPEPRQAELI